MKLVKEISVFFPAYNEAENIQATLSKANKVLKSVAEKFEIIVIDDGSRDATADVVKNLMSSVNNLRLVTHVTNQGYGAALKTGIKQSKFKLICYTDSDGQFDFSEIEKFIAKIQDGADMVIGFRVNRTDTLYRRVMARLLKLAGTILFSLNVKDVDCGFKIFRRRIMENIGTLTTSSAITETELVARTKREGYKIQQVGVKHHSRTDGEQTGGKPSIVIKAALEGLKLWMSLTFSKS